jgi:hypothetical protein
MPFQIVHIPDLPVATAIVATDRFIVETDSGTKSATQSVIDTYGSNRYLRKNVNDSTSGTITAAAFIASSSAKIKENVAPLNEDELAKLLVLLPVSYQFKKDSPVKPGQQDVGLIAEDVQKHLPLLVGSDEDGNIGVDYAKLSVYLLLAVQNLSKRVAELENK